MLRNAMSQRGNRFFRLFGFWDSENSGDNSSDDAKQFNVDVVGTITDETGDSMPSNSYVSDVTSFVTIRSEHTRSTRKASS